MRFVVRPVAPRRGSSKSSPTDRRTLIAVPLLVILLLLVSADLPYGPVAGRISPPVSARDVRTAGASRSDHPRRHRAPTSLSSTDGAIVRASDRCVHHGRSCPGVQHAWSHPPKAFAAARSAATVCSAAGSPHGKGAGELMLRTDGTLVSGEVWSAPAVVEISEDARRRPSVT